MEQSDGCPHALGHAKRTCNKLNLGHTPCAIGITSLFKFEGPELWQYNSPKGHPGLSRPPNCQDHPQNRNCEPPMLLGTYYNCLMVLGPGASANVLAVTH